MSKEHGDDEERTALLSDEEIADGASDATQPAKSPAEESPGSDATVVQPLTANIDIDIDATEAITPDVQTFDDATAPLSAFDGADKTAALTALATAATARTEGGSRIALGAKPKVGDLLKDRFLLEKKLGEGGMGAVFLAVDQRRVEARHNNPHVAVKLIHGSLAAEPTAYVALQRETDKSQTLAHPNIITVYDFDRDGDIYFMTMEALRGDVLSAKLAATLERPKIIDYINDLAQGIAYAHQRSIVHSDLKPSNIFLTEDGKLKILDFGIARAIKDAEGATTVDSSGEVVGLTPSYASCEMFEEKDPHPADDVYALGLIAYVLLTGEHPFARTKSIDAREKGLKPKKIKGLKAYQWSAIEKALAFNREDRWENADQFQKRFSGSGRRIKQLSGAMAAMAVAFAVYLTFFQPEAGPDIPFEQLPAETQQAFNAAIDEAGMAGKFGDINGQLYYLDQAYQLHPRNERVMAALEEAVDPLLDLMRAPDSEAQRAEFLTQLRELAKYPSLEHNADVQRLKRKLEN